MNENDRNKLARVRIGQVVFNASGQEIGRVTRVRRNENELDSQTAVHPADDREWMDLASFFAEPDDTQALEIAKQIWYVGYAKMRGPGLTGWNQYILPREIDHVDDKGVHLNTSMRQPPNGIDTIQKGG